MTSKKSPTKKTDEREFICPHCKKSLKSKGGLTHHINIKHDGITTKIADAAGGKGLNIISPQQELFCQLYASDVEFFGNGVQSYIEAYNVDVGRGKGQTTYETCKYYAHKLLKNTRITKRINEIFQAAGLNNTFVDKQLEKLIVQDADFSSKMKAIQEYNRMNKRTSDTVNHKHVFSDLRNMSDEELDKEIEKHEKFFQKK